MTATITRTRIERVGYGLFAWVYAYTVEIGGETYAQGPGLASCERWIRRRFPGARIVRTWEVR